jgi:hypothetical protein
MTIAGWFYERAWLLLGLAAALVGIAAAVNGLWLHVAWAVLTIWFCAWQQGRRNRGDA